jgi:hypothetical protein
MVQLTKGQTLFLKGKTGRVEDGESDTVIL